MSPAAEYDSATAWEDLAPVWPEVRRGLKLVGAAARSRASAAPDLADHYRAIAHDPLIGDAARPGETLRAVGERRFEQLVGLLGTLRPPMPIERPDDAGVVLWGWWASSALGLRRGEVLQCLNHAGAAASRDTAFSPASLDRLMWRSGRPPARSTTAPAFARLVKAVARDAADGEDPVRSTAWEEAALDRCRLLTPADFHLLAMLAQVSTDDALDLSGLGRHASLLRPTALSDLAEARMGPRSALRRLARLGLTDGGIGGARLVRDACPVTAKLSEAERAWAAESAVAYVEKRFPAGPQDPRTWPAAEALRAHARSAADAAEAANVGPYWRSRLLERLCIYDLESNRPVAAAEAGAAALRAQKELRDDDRHLADVLVNHAEALTACGRLEEAETAYRRALDLDRRDPVERAKTLNLYANSLARPMKRHEESLRRFGEALELLAEHDDIAARAAILHDRALTLMGMSRYEDALADLDESERLTRASDPTYPSIRNVQASVLNHLGRHAEALSILNDNLRRTQTTFGARAWPSAVALRERAVALEALAADGGEGDRDRARRARRAYTELMDDLEAHREGSAGYVSII